MLEEVAVVVSASGGLQLLNTFSLLNTHTPKHTHMHTYLKDYAQITGNYLGLEKTLNSFIFSFVLIINARKAEHKPS